MGSVQIVTTILAAAITAVAVWLAVRAVMKIVAVVRLGQPDPERFGDRVGSPHGRLPAAALRTHSVDDLAPLGHAVQPTRKVTHR